MQKSKIKNINQKINKLKTILSEMHSVVVAFSGGVDSTFLLKVSYDVLQDKVLAVIARSNTYQMDEYNDALILVKKIGVKYKVIETLELSNPKFINNPSDRCYYCKKELFAELKKIADSTGYKNVIYGATVSDLEDFRPGQTAAKEFNVRAPLVEAGLCKGDIRELSKELGLPTWSKPSMACLASRFPYGEIITKEKLKNVEEAEQYLVSLGFKNVRVRSYNKLARVEVDKEDIDKILGDSNKEKIVKKLKGLGFIYITLDLEGYRSGSMNEVLKADKRVASSE